MLDLQSTVARQVASALAATLTGHERGELDRVATNSGDAYDRYLRAVASFKIPSGSEYKKLDEPKRLLEESLRFDPDYTDALAMLSRVNTWAYIFGERPEDATAAKKAYERALRCNRTCRRRSSREACTRCTSPRIPVARSRTWMPW